jgi:hypothetical protein
MAKFRRIMKSSISSIDTEAMTQTHPEVTHVIQPAAGIANMGHDHLSTAALHFAALRFVLSKKYRLPVNEPVVPQDLGVLGPTTEIAKKFNTALEQQLDRYPNARVFFVLHSLAGVLVRNFLLESPEARERTAGLITLGTPHLGVAQGRLGPFTPIANNINSFAADVAAGFSETGELPNIVMTATTLDVLVSPESALPESIPASKHLYAHLGSNALAGSEVERHRNIGIDHNGLVAHPQAIVHVAQLTGQMLARDQLVPGHSLLRSA